MPATIETTDSEVLVRLPAGGAWIVTDEIGTELFRVSASGDVVKVEGVTVDPAALDEVANLAGVTASATELNLIDGSIAGTTVASKAVVVDANKATDVLALPVSGLKIGAAAGTAVDRTAAELNALTVGVAAGYKVARGEVALDGSNPTTVASGLTSIIAAVATLKGTAAPGASTSVLTTNINTTNIDIYAWKPNGAALTELVASTGTESVYWFAIGT